MSSGALIIYGAGGHGLVVAESASAAGWSVVGFLDDRRPTPTRIGAWTVLEPAAAQQDGVHVAVAVGDNTDRRRLCLDLGQRQILLGSVIHPTASVSPSAAIGTGVFIGPAAVVNGSACVDDGVIVNSGAVVEHHCHIHAYAHVGPRAVLGGGAEVLELATVGVGATVLPRVTVGRGATVGAGTVVLKPVDEGRTVVGVPAR